MTTLFTTKNGEYFIQTNNSNTLFVMDDSGQCRLATTSPIKAKNCMNMILKCSCIDESVSLKELK